MGKGEVVDEKGNAIVSGGHYRAGLCVFYYRELDREVPIPFEEQILHQDEHLIVVDKPHFLPVVPAGRFLRETLLVRLKKKLNLEDLVPIHRIDRDTAGIVIFSCDAATRSAYASLFQNRKVKKIYEALAPSLPGMRFPIVYRSRMVRGEPFFRMREIEGQPNSETHIDVFETRDSVTLYRLSPVTGRTHQLRVI